MPTRVPRSPFRLPECYDIVSGTQHTQDKVRPDSLPRNSCLCIPLANIATSTTPLRVIVNLENFEASFAVILIEIVVPGVKTKRELAPPIGGRRDTVRLEVVLITGAIWPEGT